MLVLLITLFYLSYNIKKKYKLFFQFLLYFYLIINLRCWVLVLSFSSFNLTQFLVNNFYIFINSSVNSIKNRGLENILAVSPEEEQIKPKTVVIIFVCILFIGLILYSNNGGSGADPGLSLKSVPDPSLSIKSVPDINSAFRRANVVLVHDPARFDFMYLWCNNVEFLKKVLPPVPIRNFNPIYCKGLE